jgi:hypothetical protein
MVRYQGRSPTNSVEPSYAPGLVEALSSPLTSPTAVVQLRIRRLSETHLLRLQGQVFVGELAVRRIRSCGYSVGPASPKSGDRG